MTNIVKSGNSLMEVGKSKLMNIQAQLTQKGVTLDNEQKQCGNSLLSALVPILQKDNLTLETIEQNSLIQAFEKAILLKLNATAQPRE